MRECFIPVGFAVEEDSPAVIHDTVYGHDDHVAIAEHVVLVAELEVRGEYDALGLIATYDDLEQETRRVNADRQVFELVNDDRPGLVYRFELDAKSILIPGLLKRHDQARDRENRIRIMCPGEDADRDNQMGLVASYIPVASTRGLYSSCSRRRLVLGNRPMSSRRLYFDAPKSVFRD